MLHCQFFMRTYQLERWRIFGLEQCIIYILVVLQGSLAYEFIWSKIFHMLYVILVIFNQITSVQWFHINVTWNIGACRKFVEFVLS
jgi:hypothetical protein